MSSVEAPTYKKKDFASDQEVRWCPGCGDYAILNSVQQVFAGLGVSKEKLVVVSGIGCSSRFPYYLSTFGVHSIHGRAPAVATGVKLARPDLDVWVVTGDGDALSIGGNHLIHAARRNLDVVVLLFNNQIYGLTKGQFSPTSEVGKKTPSSPFGSIDRPFNPVALMLGVGATFVARSVDIQVKHLQRTLREAHAHKGFSFVEILQNCNIFNDGAFEHVTNKDVRDDRQLDLRNNEPMVYGKKAERGLRKTAEGWEICAAEDAQVWDPAEPIGADGFHLARAAEHSDLPVPIGLFRQVERPGLSGETHAQIQKVSEQLGEGTLDSLLKAGETWNVG